MSGHAGDTYHYHRFGPDRYGHRHAFLHVNHDHDYGYAICDRCGRKSWAVEAVGSEDRMTQPDGNPCGGRFVEADR